MPRTEPDLTFERTDGVLVITITGSLIDRITVQNVSDRITSKLEPIDKPKVVICFDHIREVSSAILGAVLRIDKQIRLKNGRLSLSSMQPSVFAVFQLTRLDTILDIHESTEGAVQSFS